MPARTQPDVLIAGAGLIGLSIALELTARGAAVAVFDTGPALKQASAAAAGMLAAEDPYNPPALAPLARFSVGLYTQFLQHIAGLSGHLVPFQTAATFQYSPSGDRSVLPEHSIDPRQLAESLQLAMARTPVKLYPALGQIACTDDGQEITVRAATGQTLRAPHLIHASGAWAASSGIAPRKGQMLRVQIPSGSDFREVHRGEHIYVVPRTSGPRAGTAVIGATVEDAGFDLSTAQQDLDRLRKAASGLLPFLADLTACPTVESWAGLRPASPDLLPVLGALAAPTPGSSRQWIASGHYRNGILLAPGTAVAIADLLEGKKPAVDLSPFAPERFVTLPVAKS